MQTPTIVLYGIKNCDSVKKTRAWFDGRNLAYHFHDYRTDGLDAELLRQFVATLGLDAVLNQRSTSWRQLSEDSKRDLTPEKALQLMLETPTLIKRPIVSIDERLLVGFDPEQISALL